MKAYTFLKRIVTYMRFSPPTISVVVDNWNITEEKKKA